MPIFDQGYQHWTGKLSSHAWRWLTITRHGVRGQLKNRWTIYILLMGFAPALVLAGFLVLWGLLEQRSPLIGPLIGILEGLPGEMKADPSKFRTTVWTIAYQVFFSFEVFFAMLLVAIVGPGLVSQDLRFNAMPLYFSRPLRRFDYFFGKLGVMAVFIAIVAVLPSVLAYLLGLAFSLDLRVVRDTFRVLPASILFGIVVIVSTGTLMLAISSLTRNSRYVVAIWLAVWLVTWALAVNLVIAFERPDMRIVSYTDNLKRIGTELLDTRSAWESVVSLVPADVRSSRDVEEAILEQSETFVPWYQSAGVLAALFGLSVWILTTRVRTMDRLK
jgi:ABC-2 type transport system permease protein